MGSVSVDIAARRVTCHGEDLHLTPIEFRLLVCSGQLILATALDCK
ncbi:putative transcriptional regulator domain protein [Candidatus Erwinia dacicola]|uniref:Transcriptional regulator domain protein n=1 Tax=Candidatus Erwinia dacicola TaxID=252393 RepID=A0A328TL79_9GAMM|nr:putative transcriptional regulator domain protein [Candidatus Erwinia dacicola]